MYLFMKASHSVRGIQSYARNCLEFKSFKRNGMGIEEKGNLQRYIFRNKNILHVSVTRL